MKTPQQVLTDIEKRLARTWATDTTLETRSWPHQFPLGAPNKTDLETNWHEHQQAIRVLKDWAADDRVLGELITEPRRVFSTTQDVPTHFKVNNTYAAAATLNGLMGTWKTRLDRAYRRNKAISERFLQATGIPRILTTTDAWSDPEFDLLLQVALWFTANHETAAGLTPRQVPIPGVHAKWLNTSQPMLLALTGLESLGLADRHPPRIHFTYLDPDHRAAGGRWHDSATVGDTFAPAYTPRVVVISENKDTAIHFPEVPGGIAVEGDGFGGKTAAAFPWLVGAEHLYYWGDIDRHGYEILNGWRTDGVPVESILMDVATYEQYEPYGTNADRNNKPIESGGRKPLPMLTDAERAVHEHITDTATTSHRRVEQERIPLSVALRTVAGP